MTLKNKFMSKYFYSLIFILAASVFFITCKSNEKTVVKEESQTVVSEVPKEFDAPKTITYLPPPADSISEVSINLVGDLMCHLPQ